MQTFLDKLLQNDHVLFHDPEDKALPSVCAKGTLATFVSSQVALGALINHFMHEKRYSGHILTCLVTIPLFTGQKVYRTSNRVCVELGWESLLSNNR